MILSSIIETVCVHLAKNKALNAIKEYSQELSCSCMTRKADINLKFFIYIADGIRGCEVYV